MTHLAYAYRGFGYDWTIRAGIGKYLIVKGPGHTSALGRALIHQLRWNRTLHPKPRKRKH